MENVYPSYACKCVWWNHSCGCDFTKLIQSMRGGHIDQWVRARFFSPGCRSWRCSGWSATWHVGVYGVKCYKLQSDQLTADFSTFRVRRSYFCYETKSKWPFTCQLFENVGAHWSQQASPKLTAAFAHFALLSRCGWGGPSLDNRSSVENKLLVPYGSGVVYTYISICYLIYCGWGSISQGL